MSGRDQDSDGGNGHDPAPLTLNPAVLRRRTDRDFFLRVRDAIEQNHRALERLGR